MSYNLRVSEVLRAISRAGDVAAARPFGFSQRVAALALALAARVGLGEEERGDLLVAALLHSVGMAAVGGPHVAWPVELLQAALAQRGEVWDPEEPPTRVFIRHHLELLRFPEHTFAWLHRAGFAGAAQIARHMLERWDGQGAPSGLQGTQIPLPARLLGLAYAMAAAREDASLQSGAWIEALGGALFDPDLGAAARAVWESPEPWRAGRPAIALPAEDAEVTQQRRVAAHHTADPAAPTTVDDAETTPPEVAQDPAVAEVLRRYVIGLRGVDEDVPDIDRQLDQLLFGALGGFVEPGSPRLEAWLGILAAMADARAAFEEQHAQRVAALAQEIGLALQLPDAELRDLRLASLLYGVGRLALPSALLESRSPLTAEQRRLLQTYPRVTRSILAPLAALSGAVQIAALHAERIDGSGYPEGLTGEETPLAARILAVASTYMALIAERPYRPAYARSRALAILQAQSGALFDGLVTDSLEAIARGLLL